MNLTTRLSYDLNPREVSLVNKWWLKFIVYKFSNLSEKYSIKFCSHQEIWFPVSGSFGNSSFTDLREAIPNDVDVDIETGSQ